MTTRTITCGRTGCGSVRHSNCTGKSFRSRSAGSSVMWWTTLLGPTASSSWSTSSLASNSFKRRSTISSEKSSYHLITRQVGITWGAGFHQSNSKEFRAKKNMCSPRSIANTRPFWRECWQSFQQTPTSYRRTQHSCTFTVKTRKSLPEGFVSCLPSGKNRKATTGDG